MKTLEKEKTALQKRRQELNLTQKQVADKIGIAESAYQRYEQEKRIPSVAMALRIAAALDATVEKLFL